MKTNRLVLFAMLFVSLFMGAPFLAAEDTRETIKQGTSIAFIATADGTEPIAFQWYKNGQAMEGATHSSLSLPSLTANDSASYKVKASNEAGSAESDLYILTVEVPRPPSKPIITRQLVSVTVKKQQSASFAVGAEGEDLKYNWHFNGYAVAGVTGPTYTTGRLNPSYNNSVVAVTVSNLGGSASSMASIRVQ